MPDCCKQGEPAEMWQGRSALTASGYQAVSDFLGTPYSTASGANEL